MFAFASAFSNTRTNVSKCSLVCCGIMLTLSLAWPIFTTGYSIPFTCTPKLSQKYTHVHHQSWNQSRHNLVSYVHWQNRTRVSKHFSVVLVQLVSQVMVVLNDFLSQLTSHFRFQNSQVCQRSRSLNRVNCVCEHVSCRVVLQVFNHAWIIASHKSNVGTQTFAASTQQQHIRQICQSLNLPKSSAVLSNVTEIVCTVNQQKGVVLFADLLVGHEVRRVWVHWKQTFSDDKDCIVWIFGSDLLEKLGHFFLVEMCEFVNVFGGGIWAFLEAIVWKPVHDDMIIFLDESLNDSKASQPTSRVNKEGLDAPEVSQLFLKLHVIPA